MMMTIEVIIIIWARTGRRSRVMKSAAEFQILFDTVELCPGINSSEKLYSSRTHSGGNVGRYIIKIGCSFRRFYRIPSSFYKVSSSVLEKMENHLENYVALLVFCPTGN